ncbi:MAG: hypothetical protein JOY81_11835 [Alphaproteobacteria bacterium]|nr:hypothetical protein [Alphaproteobacteria bacterium]
MKGEVLPWHVRAGRWLLEELRELLPPTIYFFCAFNLIAMTSNLLVHHYWFALSNFLFATTMALIVGKVLLIVHRVPFIDRLRSRPLIVTVLYKTVFYAIVVSLVRVLEVFLHVVRDDRGMSVAFQSALDAFNWQHFAVVQLWLFVCFLIYVLVRETDRALGEGRLIELLFHRPS